MLGKNPGQFRKNVYSRLRSSLKKDRQTEEMGMKDLWKEGRKEGGGFLNNQERILDLKLPFTF